MKVAIYCRLSEEDKNKLNENDDSESIQNQKSMLIKYSMEQNWEIYNIYSDDDYAGSDRKRPAFNQLIKDAENKKFNIVLCKTLSRFTRELELVEKYIHGLFPVWNIRFISVVDNADTELKGNKKTRQINGLINEWYLEDMSESIKSVLNNKRENGIYIGSDPVYGYIKDPKQKGHLIIDPESAKIVREIFNLAADGFGKTAITNILNKKSIPNPSLYKMQNGINDYMPSCGTNNGLWRYSTVRDILLNEMYIGHMVQGRYEKPSYKSKNTIKRPRDKWIVVKNTHEPIIEIDLWNRVQDILNSKAKPENTGKIGLFARKVKCLQCGYSLRAHKNQSGKRFLRCSTRMLNNESSVGARISVNDLEQKVIEELRKLSNDYLDTDELVNNVNFRNDIDSEIKAVNNELEIYNKKIDECTSSIKILYMDKIKGIISDEEFIEFSKEFHSDKELYTKMIKENQNKIDNLKERKDLSENRHEMIDRYVHIERLNNEIVDILIDCIYVGIKDPITKEIPIEIHWNY